MKTGIDIVESQTPTPAVEVPSFSCLLDRLAKAYMPEEPREELTLIREIRDMCLETKGRIGFLFGENGQPGWVTITTTRLDELERERNFARGVYSVLVVSGAIIGLKDLILFLLTRH